MKSYKDCLLDSQAREESSMLRAAIELIEVVRNRALNYARTVDDTPTNIVVDSRLAQDLDNAILLIEKNLPAVAKIKRS